MTTDERARVTTGINVVALQLHGEDPLTVVQYAVVLPSGEHIAYGDQTWVASGKALDGHPGAHVERRRINLSYEAWEDAGQGEDFTGIVRRIVLAAREVRQADELPLPEWERELLERVDPEAGLLPPDPPPVKRRTRIDELTDLSNHLGAENARLRQRVEKAEAERDDLRLQCAELSSTAGSYAEQLASSEDLPGQLRDARRQAEQWRERAEGMERAHDALAGTLRTARAERDAIAATLDDLRRTMEELAKNADRVAATEVGYGDYAKFVARLIRYELRRSHKAPTTAPPSTVADQNPPVPQEGTDTPQAVQDDPGARERVSGGECGATTRAMFELDIVTCVCHLPAGHEGDHNDTGTKWPNRPRGPKAEGSPGPDYEYVTTVCKGWPPCAPEGAGWESTDAGTNHFGEHHWRRRRAHSDGTATWTNREADS